MSRVIYATGLSGFIGSHLLDQLKNDYSVILNFRRNNQVEIYQDTNSPRVEKFSDNLINNFKTDTLFHLATNYDPSPENLKDIKNIINSNFYFPVNLIDRLKIDPLSFNLITTSSYIQLLHKDHQNIYSLSKDMFINWYKEISENIVNIYLYDSFGANDLRNKVVDTFIKKILNKEQIIIPENEIEINLTEVGDIVRSLINSIKLKRGEYQIASKEVITLSELALILMKIIGHQTDVVRIGIGRNFLKHVRNSPRNILLSNNNLNLQDQLKERVEEILSS